MTTVNAGVPSQWLPRFIGHRIWSRPTAKPGAHAEWVELLDMWEEITDDPTYPYRFQAWIRWGGKEWAAMLAKLVHVEGVPEAECTFIEWDRDGETIRHYTWTPPFDDPPDLDRHPKGWEPGQPAPQQDIEFPIVESDVGEQFALFDT